MFKEESHMIKVMTLVNCFLCHYSTRSIAGESVHSKVIKKAAINWLVTQLIVHMVTSFSLLHI